MPRSLEKNVRALLSFSVLFLKSEEMPKKKRERSQKKKEGVVQLLAAFLEKRSRASEVHSKKKKVMPLRSILKSRLTVYLLYKVTENGTFQNLCAFPRGPFSKVCALYTYIIG